MNKKDLRKTLKQISRKAKTEQSRDTGGVRVEKHFVPGKCVVSCFEEEFPEVNVSHQEPDKKVNIDRRPCLKRAKTKAHDVTSSSSNDSSSKPILLNRKKNDSRCYQNKTKDGVQPKQIPRPRDVGRHASARPDFNVIENRIRKNIENIKKKETTRIPVRDIHCTVPCSASSTRRVGSPEKSTATKQKNRKETKSCLGRYDELFSDDDDDGDLYVNQLKREISGNRTKSDRGIVKPSARELRSEIVDYRKMLNKNVNFLEGKLVMFLDDAPKKTFSDTDVQCVQTLEDKSTQAEVQDVGVFGGSSYVEQQVSPGKECLNSGPECEIF